MHQILRWIIGGVFMVTAACAQGQTVVDAQPLTTSELSEWARDQEERTVELSQAQRESLLVGLSEMKGLPDELVQETRALLEADDSRVPILLVRRLLASAKDREVFSQHPDAYLAFSTNYELAKLGHESAAQRLFGLFHDTNLSSGDARLLKTLSLSCGLNPESDDAAAILSYLTGLRNRKRHQLGDAAPDLMLRDTQGNSVELRELRGKVVVLHFWAAWCGPCMDQMEELQEELAQLPGDQVEIYFVNLDFDSEAFQRERKKLTLDCKHIFSGKSVRGEVSSAFGIVSIPMDVVIDARGRVASYRAAHSQKRIVYFRHKEVTHGASSEGSDRRGFLSRFPRVRKWLGQVEVQWTQPGSLSHVLADAGRGCLRARLLEGEVSGRVAGCLRTG